MSTTKNRPITNKPLTRKQEAFVTTLVNNPKLSATEVAMRVYNASNRKTAQSIATENMLKPVIVTELAKYNNLVENTLINTINDFGTSTKVAERSLATDTAKYIHDKIHGKATQKIEQTTTGVTLNIDLTSSLDENDTQPL